MPKYSYTVINQEGQKLTGTIEAANETAARESLNKLEFPILDITEISQDSSVKTEEKSQKFEFQAVDQNGRKVVGTIAGEDQFSAFKRLVNEYHFAVEYIYATTLSQGAKDEEKRRGVVELYTTLKQEQSQAGGAAETAQQDTAALGKEENEKRAMEQADFVLQKVEVLIRDFGETIKPDDRNIIQKKADRLVRLKTSKNIDYVKHLSEDLLMYLQNQEIYLTKEKSDKKLQSFQLDMKRLLNDIHQEKVGVSASQQILSSIKHWNQQHIESNSAPSWWEKMAKSLFEFIQNLLEEPPEVTAIKDKIRIIKRQIWDYYIMYFKESALEIRAEIKETIRTLKEQKNELSLQLDGLRKKIDEEAKLVEKETTWDKINKDLVSVTGWLLAIYFILHVVSSYFEQRTMPIRINLPFPKVTEFKSYYLTMVTLLLAHSAFQIRQLAGIKKVWGNLVLFPAVTCTILFTIVNFS